MTATATAIAGIIAKSLVESGILTSGTPTQTSGAQQEKTPSKSTTSTSRVNVSLTYDGHTMISRSH